ncbi:nose resistant to fluoxetine protein 6-like [Anopheles bellator]|uniref:nose resistant to fluoxetine protein 6-like n=1 Tax=Anopheles bellator TaxID=139047 RepID=UPI002648CA4A|nr:nose resistant to fluoxetine protein 6-like [Anopheles bellator]
MATVYKLGMWGALLLALLLTVLVGEETAAFRLRDHTSEEDDRSVHTGAGALNRRIFALGRGERAKPKSWSRLPKDEYDDDDDGDDDDEDENGGDNEYEQVAIRRAAEKRFGFAGRREPPTGSGAAKRRENVRWRLEKDDVYKRPADDGDDGDDAENDGDDNDSEGEPEVRTIFNLYGWLGSAKGSDRTTPDSDSDDDRKSRAKATATPSKQQRSPKVPADDGGLLGSIRGFLEAAKTRTSAISFDASVLNWIEKFTNTPADQDTGDEPEGSTLVDRLRSWFQQSGSHVPGKDRQESGAGEQKKKPKLKQDSAFVQLLNESPLTSLFSSDELPVEAPIDAAPKTPPKALPQARSKVVKERIAISPEDFQQLLLRVPSFVPDYSLVGNRECQRQGQIFERQLRGKRLWALKMIDASAKLGSGLLQGNAHQLGDYDLCTGISTKVQVSGSEQVRIRGKYCLAHIDVVAEDDELQLPVHLLHGRGFIRSTLNDPNHFLPRFTTINWGICLPAACTFEDAAGIVKNFVGPYNSTGIKVFLELEEGNCHVRQTRSRMLLVRENWKLMMAIGFYTFVVVVTVVATLNDYEIFIKIDPLASEQQPTNVLHQMLMAFSLKKTLRQILGGVPEGYEQTGESRPTFACLYGLKGVASVALFFALRLVPLGFQPFTNRNEFTESFNAPWSVAVRVLMLYADLYLVVSGFLAAHHMMHEYRTRSRLAWFKRLVGRYLRLTFPLVPVLAFYALIWEHLGSGPQWGDVVVKNANLCKHNYHTNLLFIHNWYPIEETCAPHTFQLAIEMQLSVLAPFLMIVLTKNRFYGMIAYVLLHCLSTAIRFSSTVEDRLVPYVFHGVRLTQLYRTLNLSLTETLHRITPYLTGFGLGCLLQETQDAQSRHQERGIRWSGWLGAGVALLWCLLSPLDIVRNDFQYEPLEAAQYAALAPLAWSLGICWVIFYCITEDSSALNRLLSSRPLVLLGHLSYSLSLVQFLVFFYFVGTTRGSEVFSLGTYINRTELCLLVGAALSIALLFDLPIQNVKRFLDAAGVLDSFENVEPVEVKPTEAAVSPSGDEEEYSQKSASATDAAVSAPAEKNEPELPANADEEEMEDFWAQSSAQEDRANGSQPTKPETEPVPERGETIDLQQALEEDYYEEEQEEEEEEEEEAEIDEEKEVKRRPTTNGREWSRTWDLLDD